MRTILLGNAGAGKTTLARRLLREQPAACLSLDDLAFAEGAVRRPLVESVAAARDFIDANASWIIEGCYADIIDALLDRCDRLIFLNPGVEACVSHCRARPWEPDKFPSRDEQDQHLEHLVDWVRQYEQRDDEYGLSRHRALFDGFRGDKCELSDPRNYNPSNYKPRNYNSRDYNSRNHEPRARR